ncbi:hypothetical protein PPYR_12709 [Photinus pyralis]|uniref:Sepiapterin reductase n=1 Tax=Photinus pyralis TaxID=7054 RepID=A0A5N4A739_PHOPY|nr:sepiapterin reductase [Photinus pyralis]KAB0793089.1 hypothetical protein PPYR_12709 [Photinus pyralis]
MTAVDFSKKTLVIVTGASQGIGRTIAVDISKSLIANSKIILIARSESGLNATKESIAKVNKAINVEVIPLDLTKPSLEECSNILKGHCDAQQAIIFHNVGQVGKLTSCVTLTDIQLWRDYFDLNVFSVSMLNGLFVSSLKGKVDKLFVINITSLCGRIPFRNMAMYGAGKAARCLYFQVLAVEEEDVVVLNYSPGPVDTAMIEEIIGTAESKELKGDFISMKETKKMLTPSQSVNKLLSVLKLGNYKSGDTVDYYDE